MSDSSAAEHGYTNFSRWLVGLLLVTVAWFSVYAHLSDFADTFTAVLQLNRKTRFGEALHFFFFDTPKVLMLLVGIVFVMGMVQTFFAPERTRALLSGRRVGIGN